MDVLVQAFTPTRPYYRVPRRQVLDCFTVIAGFMTGKDKLGGKDGFRVRTR